MSAIPPSIGRLRLACGTLALAGCLLSMWFSVLFHPLIYGVIIALLSLWIGLWPFAQPNLGYRLLISCTGAVGVCIVLLVIGEVTAFVRRDGLEELGPVLFVPAFMVVMGLPMTVIAGIVAAVAPHLRKRG